MTESWEDLNLENPPNKVAALTAAPVLTINAPSKEQSQRAVALANEQAAGLTPEEVEQAKAAAQEHLDG